MKLIFLAAPRAKLLYASARLAFRIKRRAISANCLPFAHSFPFCDVECESIPRRALIN